MTSRLVVFTSKLCVSRFTQWASSGSGFFPQYCMRGSLRLCAVRIYPHGGVKQLRAVVNLIAVKIRMQVFFCFVLDDFYIVD